MSQPIRFLLLVVTAWVGLRAATLGMIPGTEAFVVEAEAAPRAFPPPAPSDLGPPPGAYGMAGAEGWPTVPGAWPMAGGGWPMAYPRPIPVAYPMPYPVYRQARAAPPESYLPPLRASLAQNDTGPIYFNGQLPAAEPWPLLGGTGGQRVTPPIGPSRPPRFDRLQLSVWAMMRSRPGPQGLGTTGSLGGSQAGARLLWRFDPRLAASLRTSAPIGTARRGGDVALGVRYQPFASIPVAITAERRQGFGVMGGPDGFALFAEGGLYGRRIAGFTLDSYLQAGAIAGKQRAAFVDGSLALTRPLWRNFSGGVGVWGAAQPGLTRLDVGPRLSLKVGRSMRVHMDYRAKVLGNAAPGSGGAVTIAGDF